ncbi:P44/Msp2 family outer membrane protein [Ehrlichia ruminantium]|uniref:P44/Msp2 family outer membrane protein n=1 Tax=Ehrlichia ruminantium TaxID=779 RepID=A0AAE6Q9M6_EHRRU|nr:P44/Msp2 family outer membrane protein [Ehrlichia ruminantium]QGR03857.1 P44/Msp2 family outer membrane protein [Ehrlichia ruminantium]QGR04784.1 P44/Msp2 family outer membrane protein [Ehrlichia ruminantium]
MKSYRILITSLRTNKPYSSILDSVKIATDTCFGVIQNSVYFFEIFYAKIAYKIKSETNYIRSTITTTFANVYYTQLINNKLKNPKSYDILESANLPIYTNIQHNTFL